MERYRYYYSDSEDPRDYYEEPFKAKDDATAVKKGLRKYERRVWVQLPTSGKYRYERPQMVRGPGPLCACVVRDDYESVCAGTQECVAMYGKW